MKIFKKLLNFIHWMFLGDKTISIVVVEEGLIKMNDEFSLIEKTPKEFIFNVIDKYSDREATYNLDGSWQCSGGVYRSTGDIFRLTKYYFPKITLRQVLKFLYQLTKENIIYPSYCDRINKRVWDDGSGINYPVNSGSMPTHHKDELGLCWEDYEKLFSKSKKGISQTV